MRAKTRFCALLIISLLTASGARGAVEEALRFRMEGIVTEEGTQQTVAGATVQVLIESEPEPEQRIRSAKTDVSGRYSVSVPIGHAMAFSLQPSPGYSPARVNDIESFATTVDQPVFKKDYQVRKGIAWHVTVRAPDTAFPLRKTFVSGGQQRDNEYLSAFCELEPQGRGVLTLPDVGGEFKIACGDIQRTLSAPEDMKLNLDKGFRTNRVTAVKQLEGGDTELRDDEGRTATLHGAIADVMGRTASLVIDVKVRPATDSGAIPGRVVDSLDQPLAGVKVEAAFHSTGGSAMTMLTAITGPTGRFRLSIPKPQRDMQVSLVVTKDGYAGLDTEPRKLDFVNSQEADVGSIKLRPGGSIPIRVIGPQGEPLEGAIVEPSGSYSARAQIARTDREGMCTLKNLATGVQPVSARFGTLTAQTKIPIVEGDNELLVLKLSPVRIASATPPDKPAASLAVGADAPPWEIAEWTDGQTRKLAAYRGKVVVLDFWGVWCGPCIHAIPAMKQLHERYKERDVVFFGIHTAGTDMTLIKRLLKQQEWKAVTGLDTGDDIVSGATVRSYAVQGFPTVVIVDRRGKVAFNSGIVPADREQFMKHMEQVAKSIDLPWPLDQDASKEELIERMTRLQFALFSREIDQALEMPRQ